MIIEVRDTHPKNDDNGKLVHLSCEMYPPPVIHFSREGISIAYMRSFSNNLITEVYFYVVSIYIH